MSHIDPAEDGGFSEALQEHCERCADCRALDIEHRHMGFPSFFDIDKLQQACFQAEQDNRADILRKVDEE